MSKSRVVLGCLFSLFCHSLLWGGQLGGRVVDADSGKAIAARVYLRDQAGKWLFVKSGVKGGSALPYREQWVPMANSVERHTTVSAHPFVAELPPGRYQITIERGKEYVTLRQTIDVGDKPVRREFRLKRWVNLAARGWYSGETHVHRRMQELPNVMLAEDLNVAFPVTFWTVNAYEAPGLEPSPLRRQGPSPFGPRIDKGYKRISVDSSHVIFPRNTEYEVFSVGGKRHTLGAIFILNHKSKFKTGMPPVAKIAEQARREGALLDLDKHSWPWSMMLVPIAKVDLYELSNNSVWRTRFGFRRASTVGAKYMKLESDEKGLTEWGWLDFGFQNYYTLLNCGIRIWPTAGTASGVHPVPLGYSRVYVHTGESFDADRWLDGLRRGRSFVSTGPMLLAKLDGQHSGHHFRHESPGSAAHRLTWESVSQRPIERIEVIVNGRVAQVVKPQSVRDGASYRSRHQLPIAVSKSSWVCVRSIQRQPDGRVRFAHTAPWHISVAGKPVRPRAEEIDFLVKRVRDQIERNKDVLNAAALEEFEQALKFYEDLRQED